MKALLVTTRSAVLSAALVFVAACGQSSDGPITKTLSQEIAQSEDLREVPTAVVAQEQPVGIVFSAQFVDAKAVAMETTQLSGG